MILHVAVENFTPVQPVHFVNVGEEYRPDEIFI